METTTETPSCTFYISLDNPFEDKSHSPTFQIATANL